MTDESGTSYLKAAYAYLYIRDFARSTEAFEQAIQCEPDNPTYYLRASITALRNEQLDQAYKWAAQAIALEPGNAEYQQHLDIVTAAILLRDGHAAYIAGEYERAEQLFQDAVERDPLNPDAERALTHLRLVAKVDSPINLSKIAPHEGDID